MLLRRLFLFCLLCLSSKTVSAEDFYDCPPYFTPTITATRLYDEPRLDASLDIQALNYMSLKAAYRKAGREELPAGLTTSTQQLDTHFEITSRALPNGMVCAQISKLDLRYGFTNTTVFIAREFTPGSCGYNEVMQHEEKHLAVNAKVLDTYLPHLENLMPGFLAEIGVIRAGSDANAQQKLNFIINQYMDRLSANMTTVYNNEQLKIDSTEEYERLSQVCNGEISRLVSRQIHPENRRYQR